MSNEAIPISPARFAEALKDLPLSTLHLKAAELRNSIAHLDYSNEQLKPFANGTEPSTNGVPDRICVEAINENEVVIARLKERIELLKAEVESRGSSWLEFRSAEELQTEPPAELAPDGEPNLVNGPAEERSSAWTDGTFQTGRIVDGEVRMDSSPGVNGTANGATNNGINGSRLDDETLRRMMEERMRDMGVDGDDEEGMHL